MPDTLDALFAFIFAGAAVWTLVPATEMLARRIGDRAIDIPNERSLHEYPTPKLGGLAVLVAVLIGGSIFLPWDQ
jgi:UDP-N-acetylmuramyl pentapeptide phosphotransferase/UDP-N-acetylglucosamine-1-phosphate transferase